MKLTFICALLISICLSLPACIEDGHTTSPSDQPIFSCDTVQLGLVYTEQRTGTVRFTVRNPHSKGIIISDIAVSGENSDIFRINVDGVGGNSFRDTEIRANDSIYVLVDALLPANGAKTPVEIDARIDFLTNGVMSSVVVSATGQDIDRLKAMVIDSDTRFGADRPYQIFDSLVVSEGATLTIEPGARLLFHDKSRLVVHGALVAEGTPQSPIVLTGDRTGEVLPDVSFDIMSRQWDGIEITAKATQCSFAYAEISNTSYGVAVYGNGEAEPKLRAVNSKLRNSGECALYAFNAGILAVGCEFAEAAHALAYLVGGNHRFDLCTFSNHYLFSVVASGAITIIDPAGYPEYANVPMATLLATNCIIYGLGDELTAPDLTEQDIIFKRCLFKSQAEDDDNFVDCIWDADPLFYTVRNEYLFDYRLKEGSPAIGAADPALSDDAPADDFYGTMRNNDLGAYAFTTP